MSAATSPVVAAKKLGPKKTGPKSKKQPPVVAPVAGEAATPVVAAAVAAAAGEQKAKRKHTRKRGYDHFALDARKSLKSINPNMRMAKDSPEVVHTIAMDIIDNVARTAYLIMEHNHRKTLLTGDMEAALTLCLPSFQARGLSTYKVDMYKAKTEKLKKKELLKKEATPAVISTEMTEAIGLADALEKLPVA